jgi:hypothetical protein
MINRGSDTRLAMVKRITGARKAHRWQVGHAAGYRAKTYSIDAVDMFLISGACGMALFGCREPAKTATDVITPEPAESSPAYTLSIACHRGTLRRPARCSEQPDARPASIIIDGLDASGFERVANRQIVAAFIRVSLSVSSARRIVATLTADQDPADHAADPRTEILRGRPCPPLKLPVPNPHRLMQISGTGSA